MTDTTVPLPQPALVEVYNPNTGEREFSRTGTAYYGSNWRGGEGFFSAGQMLAYGDAREAAAVAQAREVPALTSHQATRLKAALDPLDGGYETICTFIDSLSAVPTAQPDQQTAAVAQPRPSPSTDFIRRTNEDYAAWCATYYQADALDERGMRSLDGLWAWQEQERRLAAAQAREVPAEPLLWALLGAERDWICTSATPPHPDEARAEHITNGAQWYALTPLSSDAVAQNRETL